MAQPYIKFENVCFAYQTEQGSRQVIKDLKLEIEKGEFVCVLGHNGCGKSTLAKLCNAIETPTGGRVLVDGIDTADEARLFDLRRKVGMVFQNPDNQLVATVVEDDVAFGPENLGVERSEIRRRVDEALKSVDLYDFRFSEPHKLSGGQKQRVAIAGVIAMQPECIILDEPTAMLDPKGRSEVMKTVKMLNRERGITVIFITHYMDEAAQADRVIVLNGGSIMLDGSAESVFSNAEALKAVGLDVPEACELSRELRRRGVKINSTVLTVEALAEEISRILEDKN